MTTRSIRTESTHPRSIEPLLWMLFGAGGVLSALLMPILLFLFGLAFPLGWIAPPGHEYLLALLRNPLTRVGGFLLCTLSLFHWAHRFRYTLYDGLQIKQLDELINLFCYGGAIVGSLAAAWILFRI
jgi:fumarate reductase subunit D